MTHFWPAPQSGLPLRWHRRPIERVEDFFQRVYAPHYVVLFSSARAAIQGVLAVEGVSKAETIGVPRFASTCVIEAVSRFAVPSVHGSLEVRRDIIYHQMGVPYTSRGVVLLEDSADSLCVDAKPLFLNGTSYEVMSLPKTLGTWHGGLAVCQDAGRAEQLRRWRGTQSRCSLPLDVLRLLKGERRFPIDLWERLATVSAQPSLWAASLVLAELKNWQGVCDARRRRLEMAGQRLGEGWRFGPGRLPCALPIPMGRVAPAVLRSHGHLVRHFYVRQDCSDLEMAKYWALPLHQGISERDFENLLGAVDSELIPSG